MAKTDQERWARAARLEAQRGDDVAWALFSLLAESSENEVEEEEQE